MPTKVNSQSFCQLRWRCRVGLASLSTAKPYFTHRLSPRSATEDESRKVRLSINHAERCRGVRKCKSYVWTLSVMDILEKIATFFSPPSRSSCLDQKKISSPEIWSPHHISMRLLITSLIKVFSRLILGRKLSSLDEARKLSRQQVAHLPVECEIKLDSACERLRKVQQSYMNKLNGKFLNSKLYFHLFQYARIN